MSALNKFADAIATASAQEDINISDPDAEWFPEVDEDFHSVRGKRPRKEQAAILEADAAFAAEAKRIGKKYDCVVIYKKPRVGRKRTAAEHNFWKTPILTFIEFPDTLDLGPTELARKFGPAELNFKVTKDTFRAPLSQPARKALGKLLQSRGYALKLPAYFSIRDIQKAMKDQRDRAKGIARYQLTVEFIGDTVFCNKKSFKMQPTASSKRRIWADSGYLPVDPLLFFCSSQK